MLGRRLVAVLPRCCCARLQARDLLLVGIASGLRKPPKPAFSHLRIQLGRPTLTSAEDVLEELGSHVPSLSPDADKTIRAQHRKWLLGPTQLVGPNTKNGAADPCCAIKIRIDDHDPCALVALPDQVERFLAAGGRRRINAVAPGEGEAVKASPRILGSTRRGARP